MLVRTPGSQDLTEWDGRNFEELASQGLLHENRGLYPAARSFRLAGTFPPGTIPTTYADITPAVTTRRVLPAAAGTIQIDRVSELDAGPLVVEYLDSSWHHRSAVYVLSAATTTLAAGLGTGDTAGQPTTAWRILSATYLGTPVNAGQIDVKIGTTDVQARIAAQHRGSFALSWTVPLGQRLTLSSYEVRVDTGKLISLRVVGASINPSDGTYREIVRNEVVDTDKVVSTTYRPEMVDGVHPTTGEQVYSPIDFAFLVKQGAGTTTGAVSGTLRGTLELDESLRDPEIDKIPWVRQQVLRLTAAGLWPLR